MSLSTDAGIRALAVRVAERLQGAGRRLVVAESCTSEDMMYDIVEHIQARLAKTGKVGEYDQQLPPRAGR